MSDNSSDEENKYSDLEDGEIQQQSTTTATKISQKLLNKNLKNIKNQRKEFYLNAKEEYEVISCQLPYQFHHITVLEFGEIKSNKNFYTKTKIYPVGYKCEVTIKSSNTIIVVEIVDMDDQLEFLVTLKSSNRVFMASSEEDIFKKVSFSS